MFKMGNVSVSPGGLDGTYGGISTCWENFRDSIIRLLVGKRAMMFNVVIDAQYASIDGTSPIFDVDQQSSLFSSHCTFVGSQGITVFITKRED